MNSNKPPHKVHILHLILITVGASQFAYLHTNLCRFSAKSVFTKLQKEKVLLKYPNKSLKKTKKWSVESWTLHTLNRRSFNYASEGKELSNYEYEWQNNLV